MVASANVAPSGSAPTGRTCGRLAQPPLPRLAAHDGLGHRRAGFRLVLSPNVPDLIERYLADDVTEFLADHGLTIDDIGVVGEPPGGPKVIEAINATLGLPDEALELTWRSLSEVGNLSSSSVLHVLRDTIAKRPPSGSPGVLMAMGPGFCASSCCCAGTDRRMVWYVLLIAAVAVERVVELVVSQRNLAWSRAAAASSSARGTTRRWSPCTPACWRDAWWRCCAAPSVHPGTGLADAGGRGRPRRACGGGASPRWARSGTPASSSYPAPRVAGGPYRFLPHPNYVAVVVEGIALPLVHTAWITALVFTVLNAALLRTRIRVENAALASLR